MLVLWYSWYTHAKHMKTMKLSDDSRMKMTPENESSVRRKTKRQKYVLVIAPKALMLVIMACSDPA
mgnify:CR=1 FL=1